MKSGPLVLVIEDAADQRAAAVRILELSGFRVHSAAKALEGVAAARRERPDLILTDVRLPDLDGADAASYLRDEPDFAGIPVVLMSALAPADLESRKVETGAVDAIPKPFTPGDLVRVVRRWLAPKPGGTA